MARTFNDAGDGHEEIYTPPYDLAGLAQIISNNAEGNSYTEEQGELLNYSSDLICEILRKVSYR